MKTVVSYAALALSYATLVAAEELPLNYDMVHEAHAIVGCIAVAVLFPAGVIIMRAMNMAESGTGMTTWVHAAVQMFALVLLTANAGMGIWMANVSDQLVMPHPILGLIIFGLAWVQPFAGLAHHWFYTKRERRTLASHLHIRIGAIVVTLGIINGGLGLQFSGDSTRNENIAYGVIAGFMWLLYIGIVVASDHKRDAYTAFLNNEKQDKAASD